MHFGQGSHTHYSKCKNAHLNSEAQLKNFSDWLVFNYPHNHLFNCTYDKNKHLFNLSSIHRTSSHKGKKMRKQKQSPHVILAMKLCF